MNPPRQVNFWTFILSIVVIALVSVGITYFLIGEKDVEEPKISDVTTEPEVEESELEASPDTEAVVIPTPRLTIPSPTPPPTIPDIPLPTAELVVDGQVQQGFYGSFCWDPLDYCIDNVFTNLPDAEVVRFKTYNSVKLRLNDHADPLGLSAIVRAPGELEVVKHISLKPTSTLFFLNVDPGIYLVVVTAEWREGTVEFGFKVEVTE